MKRTPLKRKTRLTAKHANGKPRTPLKKHNPTRQAKRDARMRKWYASAEWKRQRAESLALAGHQCQYEDYNFSDNDGRPVLGLGKHRCQMTTELQVHELRYKFEKSEPKDRAVYCKAHHELVELRDHPSRRRRARKT